MEGRKERRSLHCGAVNAGTEEENRRIVASNGNDLEIRSRKYHGGKEGTRKKIRGNKIATAIPERHAQSVKADKTGDRR
jgi:hypothetical protein